MGEPALPSLQALREGKPCGMRQDRTSATLGCVIWGKPGPNTELQFLPMGLRCMTQEREVQGLG